MDISKLACWSNIDGTVTLHLPVLTFQNKREMEAAYECICEEIRKVMGLQISDVFMIDNTCVDDIIYENT